MDHRIALRANTPLHLCNERGEAIHCVVEKEIGRGGSCIVYEASRITDTGDKSFYRLKEFYPYQLEISRGDNGMLTPSPAETELFAQKQREFRSVFSRTNQLFYTDTNYASMINQLDIFQHNGTSYVLSAYSSRKTLASYQPESLKECVMLVKQVAFILGRMHRQGYLYLDTKPDNVLVVDGYQKQIQLFDFDSVLSLEDLRNRKIMDGGDVRLSYSRGFAAIELQTSKIRRLGPHTDVYGAGALLFYLLFGRAPAAPDCESDAVFAFDRMRYDVSQCDDKLIASLNDFLHRSLAVYYGDRYPDMQEAVEQLQRIEGYADILQPRIYSTRIARTAGFVGREKESAEFDRLLSDPEVHCLWLTGMGGIGKSTFVREYLVNHRQSFDTILYVHYRGSLEATISDDANVRVNTLRQEESLRTETRYFDRKLRKLQELVRGTAAILVIDNYTGLMDDDMKALLNTGFRVILVSRRAPAGTAAQELRLEAMADLDALRRLFEANLGRRLADHEQEDFARILQGVDRHTLALGLIARQIAGSHLTIADAAALMETHGFAALAAEKIDYEKDSLQIRDTLAHIIEALFSANDLSENRKQLLKIASLLGDRGMDIRRFQEILQLASKDDINELIRDGWLMLSGDILSMHSVIREAVRRWAWTPIRLRRAEQFLSWLHLAIRREAIRNNCPKKWRERGADSRKEEQDFRKEMQDFRKDKQDFREDEQDSPEDGPADLNWLAFLLTQAEDILRQCRREPALSSNVIYQDLRWAVLLYMPTYREDYILSETGDILAETGNFYAKQSSRELLRCEHESRNPVVLLRIYARAALIHADHRRFDEAQMLLEQAGKTAKKVRQAAVYAAYYDLLSAYYDIRLNGFYDAESSEDEHLLDRMLEAIDKTLHYARRDRDWDVMHLYEKNLLAKAVLWLRSGRGSEREIRDLIGRARKLIRDNTFPYAEVRFHYYLVCAWYRALAQNQEEMAERYIRAAWELADIIIPTDLQKIEEVIIPCANILFELGSHKKSMMWLGFGIRLCRGHANTDSYARVRQELCDHYWEVGMDGFESEACQELLKHIEADNEAILDPENRVKIPEEIRLHLQNQIEE